MSFPSSPGTAWRPNGVASPRLAPEALHPSLWLAHQVSRQVDRPVASGFALLDAQLPGGGWPRRTLSELLLAHPGVGELRLLAPALVGIQKQRRLVMLFDPPADLCAGSLAHFGLDVEQLLVIHTRAAVVAGMGRGADPLWALEQALKSGHVGAVLGWLPPRLRPERLRRLQLAAQLHDGPAFVLREMAAAARPSAAALRLALRPGGADVLSVRLLKRRGPPLESALRLALPPILSATARQRARAGVHPPVALQQATFVDLAPVA
ncbi:MAG: translesion DNA synthesis-associated protein ImuA [Burkholderiaceae bacterium]